MGSGDISILQELAAGPAAPAPQNIDIFLRVKPVPRPTNRIVIAPLDGSVEFNVPRDSAAGLINNSRERYLFSFNGILLPEAKQDEVFERVARPVVRSTLQGFNGTIFAYGQTGSGKTFTITGGAERYVDRGIIPRTIACVYSEIANQTDYNYQVLISYLEIYNEVGYDLLDPSREVQAMEDLPQVYIQEDEEQNIHFKNLSMHKATTEEEALNLLFLGDTNRTIAETPMNQASSRSHCLFNIMLEARQAGSDIVRRSKLHLVDLAGSERVAKSGVDGTTLKEAKYINLSLHYLEQVIIALQERSMGMARVHVPYRNSLMTLVLRDSLGGNCRTVMIATVSGDAQQMEESISTCRFAQRVALVRNQVSINEEVDPQAIIKRLKQEVRDLKDELQLLRGGAADRGPLTPDELLRLRQQLLAFVSDTAAASSLNLGGDVTMIRASWQVFKELLLESRNSGRAAETLDSSAHTSSVNTSSNEGSSSLVDASSSSSKALQEQVRKLQLQVKQRDNEIAIMISILKGKSTANTASSSNSSTTLEPVAAAATAADSASPISPSTSRTTTSTDVSGQVLSALLDTRLLADRHAAFEVFRKSYRQGQIIEENKQLLKSKYDQAKALGAAVNASKGRMNQLKVQIEQWRMQRPAACVADGVPMDELAEEDPRETQAKQHIEQEKVSYKAAFSQLRDLKSEIEHLQMLLEQSRRKLQNDFHQWLELIARQQPQQLERQPGQLVSQADRRQSYPLGIRQGEKPATVATPTSAGYTEHSSSSRPGSAGSHSRSSSGSAFSSQDCGSIGNSNATGTPLRSASQRQSSSAGISTRLASGHLGAISDRQDASVLLARLPSSRSSKALDLSAVDPQVLQAAAPHLTGNAAADEDIIKFYEARAKLLQKLGQQQ